MKSAIEGAVRRVMRTRGVAIGRYPHTGSIDDHLAEVFAKYRIDCVFDVGANDGGFATGLRHDVGYDGQIVSFEPGAAAYRRLVAQAANDPKWHTAKLALGDAAGDAQLTLNEFDKLNSLHAATDYGRDVYGVASGGSASYESVRVARLDEFVTAECEWDLARRQFLKTDTQGHDHTVLRGAAGLTDQLLGIQMELPLIHLYEETPTIAEALDLLAEQGFVVSGIFGVGRDADLRLAEVDVVAIRP